MPSSKSSPTPQPSHQWSFEAIGTQWWIGIYQSVAISDLTALQAAITTRIEAYDQQYSRFRSDSLITAMSKQAGAYSFDTDCLPLFNLYRTLYEATNGKVTPLIGGLLSDTGYDAAYSLRPGVLRKVPAWDDVLSINGQSVTVTQPVLLDFGAAGKGHLVDLLCELLEQHDITRYCVDGSGDMRASSLDAPLRIGMEHPTQPDLAIGVVDLGGQALCASAPQRRQWAGYHHIMDPQLQRSPQHIIAVWVTADSCMVADGLTTALFFTDPEVLLRQCTFEYLLLYADSSIKRSLAFPAEVFTAKEAHAKPT